MYRSILIATDGSELAGRAVDQGLGLARAMGARVTIVTVTETIARSSPILIPRPGDVDLYEATASRMAHGILDEVLRKANELGVACDAVHIPDRGAAEGILEAARARGCDLIVMATHGRRGLDRLLLGSQALNVMTHAHVPVLICR